MKNILILFAIFIFAALFFTGCAAKDEQAAAHGDMQGETVTIGTGDFYEACDKWKQGERINFSFTSSKPVKFNVHYHEKHAKEYAIKDVVVDEFSGSFIVQSPEIYCCLWQNDNPKYVTLTYNMSVDAPEKE